MGIFNPRENVELEQAKLRQTASMTVCPACLQEFEAGADTLQTQNPALGLEMHKCPKCGQLVST